MLLFFWRTIQLLHINFFTDAAGISLRGASLESPFHSISPSSGSHFEVFWGSFWAMFLYFSRAIPSFCTVDFCITLAVNGLRKILQHLSLCWGVFCRGFFWPVVGIFHHALRKIRHYVVVSLLWTFVGNSVHLLICFWNVSEPSIIFWWIFVVLFFFYKILSNRSCVNWSWTC